MKELELNTLVTPFTDASVSPQILDRTYLGELTEDGVLYGYQIGTRFCGFSPPRTTTIDAACARKVPCGIPIIFLKGKYR